MGPKSFPLGVIRLSAPKTRSAGPKAGDPFYSCRENAVFRRLPQGLIKTSGKNPG